MPLDTKRFQRYVYRYVYPALVLYGLAIAYLLSQLFAGNVSVTFTLVTCSIAFGVFGGTLRMTRDRSHYNGDWIRAGLVGTVAVVTCFIFRTMPEIAMIAWYGPLLVALPVMDGWDSVARASLKKG